MSIRQQECDVHYAALDFARGSGTMGKYEIIYVMNDRKLTTANRMTATRGFAPRVVARSFGLIGKVNDGRGRVLRLRS